MESLRLEAEHLLNANHQLRPEVDRLRRQIARSSSDNNTTELYPSHIQNNEIDEIRRDIRRLQTEVKVLMQRPVLTDPLTITEHFLPPELHLMVQKEVLKLDRPVLFEDVVDFLAPKSISVADNVLVPPHLRPQYLPTFFSVNHVPVSELHRLNSRMCYTKGANQSIYDLALQQIRASDIVLDCCLHDPDVYEPEFYPDDAKAQWEILRRLPQLEHLQISLFPTVWWDRDRLAAPEALFQYWAHETAIKSMHKLKTVNVQLSGTLGGTTMPASYGPVDELFCKYAQRTWVPELIKKLRASVVKFHPRCQITEIYSYQG